MDTGATKIKKYRGGPPPGGNPPNNGKWPKIAQKPRFFDRKQGFWTPQAETYPTKVAVFHLGKIRKFRKIPTQIPKYSGPFLTSWLDLGPARRSGLKKAARGWPRIQIWSHEGPNQAPKPCYLKVHEPPCKPFWKAMSGRSCLDGWARP